MKVWVQRFILVCAVIASSVLASANSPELSLELSSVELTDSFILSDNSYTNEKLLTFNPNTEETIETTVILTDLKEFSSDQLPTIPTQARAILFERNLQTQPTYLLKFTFNPPDTSIQFMTSLLFISGDSPWFIQIRRSSSSRLSGWKDGNSLYTASITYY